jgi:hypothetical protein
MLLFLLTSMVTQAEPLPKPLVVVCKFEHLPRMELTIGSSQKSSTLQIGTENPVQLFVGSNLMTAEAGAQEFTFSLRLPASVTVSAPGNDTLTYEGECVTGTRP